MVNTLKATVLGLLLLLGGSAWAGEVDVIKVRIEKNSDQTYQFHVTLRHDDTGWDHYANRWEILSLEGKILATRVLYHPHVNEQPFTRSLTSVKLPKGTEYVIVRGHDSVHEYGGKEIKVKVPK